MSFLSTLEWFILILISVLLLVGVRLDASVIDIQTEDYLGKIAIEKRDFVIVSPSHSLANSNIPNITICESKECREKFIEKMKHLYRTNSISVFTVK